MLKRSVLIQAFRTHKNVTDISTLVPGAPLFGSWRWPGPFPGKLCPREHRLQLVQEPLHVVQAFSHTAGAPPVLAEVDVEGAGHVEEAPDVFVAG